jgi:hypothetical protein
VQYSSYERVNSLEKLKLNVANTITTEMCIKSAPSDMEPNDTLCRAAGGIVLTSTDSKTSSKVVLRFAS